MNNVTEDILYIGVNDHKTDLFEGQYAVPNGMAYNSYMILDDKIAVIDTVDQVFTREWLDNLEKALHGRKPDYLIVQHMEPDHSANIENFVKMYPKAKIVANAKTFEMIDNFFDIDMKDRKVVMKNGSCLNLGAHTLQFVFAPMVHWPEVMVTYDTKDKVLFSADGFGKFGALDIEEEWLCEARRYYIGIVGKYGAQVQAFLKEAKKLDIKIICPLHGPVLSENLGYYLGLYDIWSSYDVESEGVMIAYTSVYGHTAKAVRILAEKLRENGCPKVVVCNLAREDMSKAVENAFRYGRLVLATTTYNSGIFPFMRQFIEHLTERNFQKRTIGIIENGSWAPQAAKEIKNLFAKSQQITWLQNTVKITSTVNQDNMKQLDAMAKELCRDYIAQSNEKADKQDFTALFKIGYGLYVITSNDGRKDNGLVVNTVTQVTDTPNRIAVTINKKNYSHHVIAQTGKMNVNCLSVEAPFSIFERFGFQSGRNVDKFADLNPFHSDNGLAFLPRFINAFLSVNVEQYVDLDTHGMFIGSVTEARVMSDKDTMTYTYYHKNVKPKPDAAGKKGYVCKVCGYIYEGDVLPEDFICPLCKHGAADFEPLQC